MPGAAKTEPGEPKNDYGYVGIPVVGYASGFGTGFGAVGSFYRKEADISPYKYEIDGQIYFMTSGMQSHRLRFDYLDVLDMPLRIRSLAGLLVMPNENYCGQGMRANCAVLNANPNYYLTRYWEAFGTIDGRWRLRPMPHKVEIIASWRGSFYQQGTFSEKGAYADSLYEKDFGSNDGSGFASVLEAGILIDNRDFEPSPTSGYWLEATMREASPFWGSSWSYLGVNLSLRGYVPLIPNKRLVLASQIIFDAMAGKAPLQEIVRVGGTTRYYNTFGGQDVGRGLREQYFPGRLKAYKQFELRYNFVNFKLWKWDFDLAAASFADLGLVAWDRSTLDQEPFEPSLGFGGGLRIMWDKAVVLRFDVGTSPIEQYSPRFYFVIGNVF